MTIIGPGNARTLSPEFTPFVNRFMRPVAPTHWSQVLILAEQFREEENQDAEESTNDGESETDHEMEVLAPKITYMEFKRSEKIWLSYQKHAKDNEDAVKNTLSAVYGGLSKSMQAQYAFNETPAALWEELRHTKDLSNRKMDTSAVDTY
ncbi:hypothetical protein HDU81_004757 [Chytriomyces hyalinus]|nr:hypothetical protein HDU81_004757 [Chytriomyces hyalinus]